MQHFDFTDGLHEVLIFIGLKTIRFLLDVNAVLLLVLFEELTEVDEEAQAQLLGSHDH